MCFPVGVGYMQYGWLIIGSGIQLIAGGEHVSQSPHVRLFPPLPLLPVQRHASDITTSLGVLNLPW
jgi:hypothetical protein